jgi:hypothetical protein
MHNSLIQEYMKMKRMLLTAISLGIVSSAALAQGQPAELPLTQPRQGTQPQQGEGGYGGGGYGRGEGGMEGYGAGYGGYGGGYGGEGGGYGGYGEGGMGGRGYGAGNPRQTRKLIDRWKASKDGSERANIEKSLREGLKVEFSRRLAAHENEIKQLEEKVRQLRERLDLRREKQDEIVDNRLQQLLRDAQGLGWGADGADGQAGAIQWFGMMSSEPTQDLFGAEPQSAEPLDPQPVLAPESETPIRGVEAPSDSALAPTSRL